MVYRLAADLVVLLHLAFIVFMVVGGLLAWRWRAVAWIHLPVVGWGVAISVLRFRCPLTPLEIHLRELAGGSGYDGGFIDHYLMAIVYPSGLTPTIQIAMALGLAALNIAAYLGLWQRSQSMGYSRGWTSSPDTASAPTPNG